MTFETTLRERLPAADIDACRMRQALDTSGEVIFMTDREGIITFVNREFEALYGYGFDEVVGRATPRILSTGHADAGAYAAFWKTLLDGDVARADFVNRTKRGALVHVEGSANPIRDEQQRIIGFLAVQRDVTARRRLAELLERQNHLLSAIVDHSPVGIAVFSGASFVCESANPSLQRLLAGRAITGLSFADLWPSASADVIEMFAAVLTTGLTGECLDVAVNKSSEGDRGARTSVTITASLLQSSATPNSILAIFIDTTARKALEAQFLQAQKMEAIGRLAGGVAHDFNNLLTAILGYTELLRDTLEADDPRRDDVAEIRRAGESATTLTRHLLSFSRKQIAQPTIIDLNDAISQFLKILRRTIGEDVEVALRLDPRVRPIRMDVGQLDQILMNLAVNARDAMTKGGRLSIQTGRVVLRERAHAAKRWIPPGSYATLAIADTGTGMSSDALTHLFEPFFTTKDFGKGTGLGLSTVYGIVEQNGGYIAVTSEAGIGTTFTIYLPAIERRADSQNADQAAASPRGHETILIAEDNEGLRTLAVRTLESCGYHTLAAAGAAEALALSRNYTGRIDVLLTDVVMPGGDGLGLSRAIAAERPETRILFMSGHTDEVISHHGLLQRDVHFLQKPFNRDKLARKIREVLGDYPGSVGSAGSGQ